MVRFIEKRTYGRIEDNTQKYIAQIACLSTDTKPTEDLVTGSVAVEVDTGDVYLFDETSSTWENIGGIGGGGGQNTLETANGTLDDPWGDIDLDELKSALANDGQNASAYIIIDATTLGQSSVESYIYLDGSPEVFVTSGASSDLDGFYVEWSLSGTLTTAKMSVSGTPVDISSYASALPTTLKVIWHPVP